MPHIKAASNIEWFYDLEGEGENVLFLHGWGVDRRIWRQQSKYFMDHYRVMSIDLPGHGKSSFQLVPLLAMAQDLSEILGRVGFNSCHVVASSLGGMFALKLYELEPQKFKRMIFVGSLAKFAKSEEYPYGLDVEQIRKLNGQLNTAYPSIVNIFFRSLFTKEERESRRFKWLQKFRQTDEVPIKEALAEYLDILEKEDLRPVLDKVKAPMQFIFGEGDYICPPELQKLLMKKFAQARFDIFPRCGHFPFLSSPHEFNAVVEEFLKDGLQ